MFTCFLRIASRTRTTTAGTAAGVVARRPYGRPLRTGRPARRRPLTGYDDDCGGGGCGDGGGLGGGCYSPTTPPTGTRRQFDGGHRVAGPESAWAVWTRSHGPFL